MADSDRSRRAGSERHGLQNAGLGERPVRRKLEGSNGSLCKSLHSDPLLPLSFEESCRSPFKLDLPLQNVNVIDLHLILTICGAGHLRHQR